MDFNSERKSQAPRTETAESLKMGAQDAREGLEQAKSKAKDELRSQLEDGKTGASEAADTTAEALEDVSSDLYNRGHETLAQATDALASQLTKLADHIENKSVDELAGDARDLARRNPGLLIAGGLAIGFALTRFVKASGEREHSKGAADDNRQYSSAAARGTDGAGSGDALHAPRT